MSLSFVSLHSYSQTIYDNIQVKVLHSKRTTNDEEARHNIRGRLLSGHIQNESDLISLKAEIDIDSDLDLILSQISKGTGYGLFTLRPRGNQLYIINADIIDEKFSSEKIQNTPAAMLKYIMKEKGTITDWEPVRRNSKRLVELHMKWRNYESSMPGRIFMTRALFLRHRELIEYLIDNHNAAIITLSKQGTDYYLVDIKGSGGHYSNRDSIYEELNPVIKIVSYKKKDKGTEQKITIRARIINPEDSDSTVKTFIIKTDKDSALYNEFIDAANGSRHALISYEFRGNRRQILTMSSLKSRPHGENDDLIHYQRINKYDNRLRSTELIIDRKLNNNYLNRADVDSNSQSGNVSIKIGQ
ncbi:MAG: hypothetical protein OIF57_01635 [Marinobacterium sp.]|nr:hypothetical protein [Marinobacterium sp.]